MEWIILPRGGGKTERLIAWARERDEAEARVIVTPHSHAQLHLARRGQEVGLQPWQVRTWREIRETRGLYVGGHHGRAVYAIDDVDLVLSSMLGGVYRIAKVSGTS